MEIIQINSLESYILEIEKIDKLGDTIILFRGQPENFPLLPNISRKEPKNDTTSLEKKMLNDFKRRSSLLVKTVLRTDWEWLTLAQHFGLQTRLLDWSSNPLVALWFACSNKFKFDQNSFVYVFQGGEEMQIDIEKEENPFDIISTKILKPQINNERIIAQAGWFTIHGYTSTEQQFLSLETTLQSNALIKAFEINKSAKIDVLRKLSIFGINNRTLFPDLSGLSSHLNWKYIEKQLQTKQNNVIDVS